MVTLAEGVLGLALFWLVLSMLSQRLNLVRFGILVGPMMLIWRTTKPNLIIKFLTHDKVKKGWKWVGTLFSYVALTMFFAFPFLLVYNLVKGYFGQSSYLLPESPINYLDVSILMFVFPLFFAVTVNQVAKGLMSSAEGVEIKSSGLFVVVFLFFGVVQSSQESLEKISRKSVLRIISFGVIANLLFSLIFLQFAGSSQQMIDPFFGEPQGAIVTSVEPNGPSYGYLLVGDIIVGLKKVTSGTAGSIIDINSRLELIQQLRTIPAGNQMVLVLSNIEIIVEGIVPPVGVQVGSYLGIEIYDYLPPNSSFVSPLLPYYLDLFIQWSIALNLFFATFNLLPLPFSDGRKISEELLTIYKVEEESRKKYLNYYSIIAVVLVLLNLQATLW